MYRVAVVKDFIAQHYLIGGDWGTENQLHSHHYKIELVLEGVELDQHGYLVDIVDIETAVDALTGRYRDRTLNDLPEFADANPSIEHFAAHPVPVPGSAHPGSQPGSYHRQAVGKRRRLGILQHRDRKRLRMRVGLLIYDSLDAVSGGYLYDRMLVDYLRGQGEEVEIIAIPRRSYALQLADNLSPALFRHLTQASLDLVLQDELNHPSVFWLNRRRERSKPDPGRPQVVSIVHHLRLSENHPGWQRPMYRWVESRYLGTVDGFIFNSQTTRRSVEALTGGQVPSLVAYPAGDRFQADITAEEIASRACQDGPLRLLFVGNLIPRKGLHTLLSAMQQLPEDAATLTVVGAPGANQAYNTAIFKQVTESSLQSRVKFVGHLDHEELAEQDRSHHILVVPSSYEGFGIVYLEGMSFGLPAVGSSDGGAGEVISHAENGFLVAPGEHSQLSRLLLDLHQDRSKLAQMSLAARRRFLEHPTWEETCAAIHSFLKQIANRAVHLKPHRGSPFQRQAHENNAP